MNFIEAHKIFYDYCGALSKGNFSNTELPCGGDIKKINDAAIIVISHFYFYHLGTQEQFDTVCMAPMFLTNFKDEESIKQEKNLEAYIEKNSKWPLSKIHKEKLASAKASLMKYYGKSLDDKRYDDLLAIRENITGKFFDKCHSEEWKCNSISDSIKAAQYLYSLLDIEYTDFDTHSFFTMQMMREMKEDFDNGGFLYYNVELNKQLVQHIKKYWDYILTHNV